MIGKLACKLLDIHTFELDHIITEDLNNGYHLETKHLKCTHCDQTNYIINRKNLDPIIQAVNETLDDLNAAV